MNSRENDPHHVYTYYDSTGAVLYIGCTSDLTKRDRQHAVKPWYGQVARFEFETFPNRWTGRTAERALIQREQPRHNILEKSAPFSAMSIEQAMAIARNPDRLEDIIREFSARRAAEREAELADQKMMSRTMRRLRESKFRAAYLRQRTAS